MLDKEIKCAIVDVQSMYLFLIAYLIEYAVKTQRNSQDNYKMNHAHLSGVCRIICKV